MMGKKIQGNYCIYRRHPYHNTIVRLDVEVDKFSIGTYFELIQDYLIFKYYCDGMCSAFDRKS